MRRIDTAPSYSIRTTSYALIDNLPSYHWLRLSLPRLDNSGWLLSFRALFFNSTVLRTLECIIIEVVSSINAQLGAIGKGVSFGFSLS